MTVSMTHVVPLNFKGPNPWHHDEYNEKNRPINSLYYWPGSVSWDRMCEVKATEKLSHINFWAHLRVPQTRSPRMQDGYETKWCTNMSLVSQQYLPSSLLGSLFRGQNGWIVFQLLFSNVYKAAYSLFSQFLQTLHPNTTNPLFHITNSFVYKSNNAPGVHKNLWEPNLIGCW